MLSTVTRRSAVSALACALMLTVAPLQAQTAPAAQAKPSAVWGTGPNVFSLATGSPGELGLLEVLAEDFARENQATVKWFKAGSGAAMRLLKERKVDMVLAHAPAAERQAVADGWAKGRVLIGSNEFWIVGPASDPAGIAQAADAAAALRRIQESGAKFVSRGDNSGTHQKENEIWRAAGLAPGGAGYIVTKDFMTASMKRANDEGAYFLTDSSTFIAERKAMPALRLLFRGGEIMANPYHTLYLSEATPGAATALRFGAYLNSDKVQALMRNFGREPYGEPMYYDAVTTAKNLAR
ncbi:MAG: substrate-binding domain-containing protein [Burkholderiaceae bacterium]